MAIGFYCTMIRGDKTAWLAGPFETKEAAEAKVPAAREAAYEADPRSHFDAFGVAKLDCPNRPVLPLGVLNGKLGLLVDGLEGKIQ